MVNILCVGDVVGSIGCEFLRQRLPVLKKLKGIDLCIVNGENSADGNGITHASATHLLDSGADVITTGNHSFRRKESFHMYDSWETLLRPANYPAAAPGRGFCVMDLGRVRVGVISLMGTMYMDSLESPFEKLDQLLGSPDMPKICVVDFHAEATGEKRALGFYADGRVTALFGTHTHVPTADTQILPKGTGFVSDLGMTGPAVSVLGIPPHQAINRFLGGLPARYECAEGPCKLNAVLFTVDTESKQCVSIERVDIQD